MGTPSCWRWMMSVLANTAQRPEKPRRGARARRCRNNPRSKGPNAPFGLRKTSPCPPRSPSFMANCGARPSATPVTKNAFCAPTCTMLRAPGAITAAPSVMAGIFEHAHARGRLANRFRAHARRRDARARAPANSRTKPPQSKLPRTRRDASLCAPRTRETPRRSLRPRHAARPPSPTTIQHLCPQNMEVP